LTGRFEVKVKQERLWLLKNSQTINANDKDSTSVSKADRASVINFVPFKVAEFAIA
jgi:hypothetical protein